MTMAMNGGEERETGREYDDRTLTLPTSERTSADVEKRDREWIGCQTYARWMHCNSVNPAGLFLLAYRSQNV